MGRLRAVAEALEDAASGRTKVLVIEGEPGSGKTTVWRAAIAAAPGWLVVSATGVEWEADLPLAALSLVLPTLGAWIPMLTPLQQTAVRAALGEASAEGLDPFVLGAALVALLAAAAEERPVLLAIDDCQWIDSMSWRTFTFALRRLDADRVAAVVTARTGELHDVPDSFERIPLPGLDGAEARALLSEATGVDVDPSVADTLTRATNGLPLALRETAPLLTAAQLEGRAPLPDPVPIGPDVRTRFAQRLTALPERCRRALATVALAGSASQLVPGAFATLGLTSTDLRPAVAAGIITPLPRASFNHPLLRAAAVAVLDPADVATIHRALARAAGAADPIRASHHLAAAIIDADETVAAAHDQAARLETARGGIAAAADASTRAALATPDGPVRDQRLLDAGRALVAAGRFAEADDVLQQIPPTASPTVRADATISRAVGMAWISENPLDELDRIHREFHDADPNRAAVALVAWMQSPVLGRPLDLSATRIPDAIELLPKVDEPTALLLRGAIAWTALASGDHATARDVMSGDHADRVTNSPVLPTDSVLMSLYWLERFDVAMPAMRATIARMRQRSELTHLPYLLSILGEASWLVGDWPAAAAALDESLRLIDDTGMSVLRIFTLASRARLAATMGDDRTESFITDAMVALSAVEIDAGRAYVGHARGLAALASGDNERALTLLRELDDLATRIGFRGPSIPYLGDLVEATIAVEAPTSARRVAERVSQLPWVRASRQLSVAAARNLAAFAPAADLDAAFAPALAPCPVPFETARSRLAFGQRLAEVGRCDAARSQLALAMSEFDRLGATPWLARAQAAHHAAGGTSRPPTAARPRLTDQERVVCMTVGTGASTRQAANALVLSPKTIEYHLSNAYRKLGIANRAQLATLVAKGFLGPA